ncbi:MAG TPA: MerR family transcriptional regulator [Kofleriaceae bacterium]|nr:MerR family transcriptional regulator [Kofleriaceae bacterium]
MDDHKQEPKLLRVGELARAVGKTVRAMHLYEELGLLEPAARSEGGFRLYAEDAVERIRWIVKLQAIGFTLPEIQGFVKDFQAAGSGKQATDRVRAVFRAKQDEIREQITQLKMIENDLHEAVAYLDSCTACSTEYTPDECGVCGHHGHEHQKAPRLFAGLSRREREADRRPFHVAVTDLIKDHDRHHPDDHGVRPADEEPAAAPEDN